MELKILVFCGQLIQTSFYAGVLVTHTGEQKIGSVSGRIGIYATAFSRKERLYKSCIFHNKIGCILRVLPVNQVLNDSVTIQNRVN